MPARPARARGRVAPGGAGLRRALAFAARAALSAAVLVWLVRELGGASALGEMLLELPLSAAAGVLLVFTLDRLLMTYKWLRLLRVSGEELPLLRGTQIYCAAMVWGMFLPATVGADAVRALCTRQRGVDGVRAVASILVERAVGFLASLLLGLVGLGIVSVSASLPPALDRAVWVAAAVLLVGSAVVGASLSETAYRWLDAHLYRRLGRFGALRVLGRIHESYGAYRAHRGELWIFFGLSMLEQLAPALCTWLLAAGLGLSPSPVYVAAAVAIAYVVARVPVSLGGLGVLEGVLVFLLVAGGMPGEQALAITVATRILEITSWLPWWLSFIAAAGTPRPPRAARA